MGFIPPESVDPVAKLTEAGRSLLARSIIPRAKLDGSEPSKSLVSFKLSGFALGDGGYFLDNPLTITPIQDNTKQARATITVLDNRFDVNDSISVNGVAFDIGLEVVASGFALGGTNNGGSTSGFNNFLEFNNGGGGGTLEVAPNSLPVNAFTGSRLRIIDGTLGGLEGEIVSNTSSSFEIGFLDPEPPLPTGSPLGISWVQAGSGGLLPDSTTQWQVITASPGASTWVPGVNEEETAKNIADVINASSNPLIKNVVTATTSINAVITLRAVANGTLGNLNTLTEADFSGLSFNNFSIFPTNGFFAGGTNPDLENAVFPSTAPNDVKEFLDFEFPNPEAVSLVCRAGQMESNFGLGEVGIFVDIIDSVNPQEIGERVLYAVGHFPIVAKNSRSVFLTRVITQY